MFAYFCCGQLVKPHYRLLGWRQEKRALPILAKEQKQVELDLTSHSTKEWGQIESTLFLSF